MLTGHMRNIKKIQHRVKPCEVRIANLDLGIILCIVSLNAYTHTRHLVNFSKKLLN